MSELILVCPAENSAGAASLGLPLAAAAYRVGKNGELYGCDFDSHGSVMLICGGAFSDKLAGSVRRECERRGFSSVLWDTDSAGADRLMHELSGRELILPENTAASGASALISTAVSGGTFEERFLAAVKRFGANRVNAAVEISREYFTLTGRRGQSRTVGEGELKNMLARADSAGFSRQLCCKYVISGASAVLYDDMESVREKILRLNRLGVRRIFLPYPELVSGNETHCDR